MTSVVVTSWVQSTFRPHLVSGWLGGRPTATDRVRLTHEEVLALCLVERLEHPRHRFALGILEVGEALEHVMGVDVSFAVFLRPIHRTLLVDDPAIETRSDSGFTKFDS